MTLGQEFRKGFWRDNAVFRLLLGLCLAALISLPAAGAAASVCFRYW